MTYPIYFSFGLAFPWRRRAWVPRFQHDRPVVRNKHFYTQRYTGFEWLALRVGLVWKNPLMQCDCARAHS